MAKSIRFNSDMKKNFRVSIGKLGKRFNAAAHQALQDSIPDIERVVKSFAARKDEHTTGGKINHKTWNVTREEYEIAGGPYSKQKSSKGRAAQILGHSAEIVHDQGGDLARSIGVSSIKRRKVGGSTQIYVDVGYLNNPPDEAEAVIDGTDRMFARDPFDAAFEEGNLARIIVDKFNQNVGRGR